MIDLARIRQQPTKGRILSEFLSNAPQLLLMLYGLICILTLRGRMLYPTGSAFHRSLHFIPVNGTVAALVGWQYVAIGLFIYMSDGPPPGENRLWFWRIGRGLLRWGSLAVALFCFFESCRRVSGESISLEGLPPYLLLKIISFAVGLFLLLSFLFAMYQREQIKRDLDDRSCRPLRIWWRPAAYWVPWGKCWSATGFRVIYADPAGLVHHSYCFVYRSFLKDWRWGNRRVKWLTDALA